MKSYRDNSTLTWGGRNVSWFTILLISELLIFFCSVFQYAIPLHQYTYQGDDLTGSFCSHLALSDDYDLGCYLDKSLVTDDSVDLKSLYITTPFVDLPKGSYEVTINYSTDDPNQKYAATAKYRTYSVITGNDGNRLPMNRNAMTYAFFSPTKVKEYQVHVDYSGAGYIFIESISIRATNAWKNVLVFCVILLSMIIDGIVLWYRRISPELRREARLTLAAIIFLTVFASLPLLSFFLHEGDDLPFHLNRIEAIKNSLLCGQFPNRVSSLWNNGYGYASAVFYGEAFLYLPALLRLIGFPIQTAYKFYVVVVNLATVLISYHYFKKIAKDGGVALMGSMVYVLAPYRLVCIYTRAAVGEYTAMLFFPLIFYGLYQIYIQESEDTDHKNGWVLLFLGYSGLIQSHVISCVIVSVFVGLFCLLFIKKTIRPKRLGQIVKAGVWAFLLNLWFLVPFADYFRRGYIHSTDPFETLGKINAHGAFLNQMFTVFQEGYKAAYTTMRNIGQANERNYALGGFVLVAVIYIFYRLYRERREDAILRLGDYSLAFAVLAMCMSTIWMPWDFIQQMNGLFLMITRNIQFPWRFLGICCFFFTVTTVCLVTVLRSAESKHLYYGTIVLLGCVFWLSADYYMYSYTQNVVPRRYVNERNLDLCDLGGAEYLSDDTPADFTDDTGSIPGSSLAVLQEYRERGAHIVKCSNPADADTYIDIPFLPYKGYRSYDCDTGEELEVSLKTPGRVRVVIPEGYSGTLRVQYKEPWYWRVAEGISLLTLVVGVIILVFRSMKSVDNEVSAQ